MLFLKNSIFLHGLRVSLMSDKLCKNLNVNFRTRINIFIGSALHDIGKYSINKEILNKTSRLTNNEFELIKTHTDIKLKILKNKTIKNIILYHHENVNGTGYKGLIDIPLEAKILRVCDMYDALTHNRVYHKKVSAITAINIMVGEKENFDSFIFKKFVHLVLCDKSYNADYNSYLKNSLRMLK